MIKTVSIIIINGKKEILTLRRSSSKEWYPGKWDIISGKFKRQETADECFKRELFEEAGITDYECIETKPPYIYEENGLKWLVHPYRCKVNAVDVKIDAEHCEYKWVAIHELFNLDLATPVKTELKVFYNL